jgi:hypothetical protein
MLLTPNDTQLWERIKKVEGQKFPLIETRRLFKVGKVANEGVTTENVETGKTSWIPRENVTETYKHVKKYGRYTSADYNNRIIRVPGLAQIIALLALAVPEEIAPFTQDQGERLFGERLRGIRKKDWWHGITPNPRLKRVM